MALFSPQIQLRPLHILAILIQNAASHGVRRVCNDKEEACFYFLLYGFFFGTQITREKLSKYFTDVDV